MSKATKEEMKTEALDRIDTLVKNAGLNPNVYKYFEEERLYYSYLTAGGFMGSIDTISYDPSYEEAARNFERIYNTLVYHCVEDNSPFGKCLILLYVGSDKEDWPEERPAKDNSLLANVVNLDEDFDEIGYVRFESMGGALIRVG